VADGVDLITVGAAASALLWLLAAGLLYVVRQPDEPPLGPRTLELGDEPPAVANFLAHRFRVTDEAVPATLLDLAARGLLEIEQRRPEVFFVRLLDRDSGMIAAYEARVLRHLRERASDGVVPAQALTTGPREQSGRWRRAFAGEVIVDAQRRGLSRDRLDDRLFAVLGAASLLPAALVWALVGEFEAGFGAFLGALALLGWIKARHPQQDTPEGRAAASRWLGVRAELAENEIFATRSPLEVPLWDRLLAYGAALGVAGGASRPLPMGVEADHEAWSAYGGQWREVRIRYPRLLPLAWGSAPHVAVLRGIATGAAGAAVLVVFAALARDAEGVWLAIVGTFLGLACAAIGLGVALVAMGIADFGAGRCVTGPILRLRALGSDKRRRHFVAVDDGTSSAIRAWVVDPFVYGALAQGDTVTVEVTRVLGFVRSLEPATVALADSATATPEFASDGR
jgi:hypothetical protein